MAYLVAEYTASYLPENDDPLITEDYDLAVAHAHELADELEEQGYECDRGWASFNNYLAIYCTRPDTVVSDLGRLVVVEQKESE